MAVKTAKESRKEIVISALISSLIVTVAVGTLVWNHFSDWSPFENVTTKESNNGRGIMVDVETKIPTKTKVEYGTTSLYLNETETSKNYNKNHTFVVSEVIPEKRHYIRLVAYTENGKEYKSDFYMVE